MEAISFEQALISSKSLLDSIERGEQELSAAELELRKIVSTVSGARGFLVVYLTAEFTMADKPPQLLIDILADYPDIVCDLLAKNLVMSSATSLTHERAGHAAEAKGSWKVQKRTAAAIAALKLDAMQEKLQEMWLALSEAKGGYAAFLQRWQYDGEQLQRARDNLSALMPTPKG